MTRLTVRYRLTGKTLRWVACIVLHDSREALAVAEIVARIEALGYEIPGARPGKAVSDALRWEVGRGRVVQLERGPYRSGFMQRSTEWSMRKRVESLKDTIAPSLVATTAATKDRTSDRELSLVATTAAETDALFAGDPGDDDDDDDGFAPINIDDLVTPEDDIEPASGWS